ncbi:MAG TPA: hypothetical protein VHA56_08600 [Mucilaginibacter sp.]|nr:hypothetical protein [Mucilaginibacter sp.]
MSWDIVLFNSRQKIETIEEIDEDCLEPTDFCSTFEHHFDKIVIHNNHREIKGIDFSIDYFIDDELVSNKMISLYGEAGLYELVILARQNNWQIFDTGMGEMVDLENPSKNGYMNFQNYLRQILDNK